MTARLPCLALASLLATSLFACPTLAEEEERKITFDDHIKPIFREHCTACHSESDKESDLALDSYSNSLAGGSSGEVIAEGNASGSRLFALLTHAERPFMPPDQDPIPKDQIELVKTWIEQGMPENSGSKIKRSNAAAAAMLGSVSSGKPEGPPPMPESVLRQPVMETDRSSAISAMASSPWAPLLAVGGQKQVSLYHCESGELLGIIPFPEGEPQSLTFTRDGKQLLIGGGQHSVSGCAVLVDIATGDRITKVGDELDIVLAADISPDKQRIAIAGPQKIVRIFDSLSGELVVEMKKHTDWIFSLRYSPDGILLASGDRSNGLIVWEADTGNLYAQLNGHKDAIRSIDFRADSNVLASASLDGTIKLWDMFESREIRSWNAHGGGATSVNFAHDGTIASAGRDGQVKLWNGNGELQKEMKGLSDAALEVSISGDAAFVAAGDWQGQVRLWDASKPDVGRPIAANPPSIDSRLAAAEKALEQIELKKQQLESAHNQASTALQTATEQQQATAATHSQLTQAVADHKSDQTQVSASVNSLEQEISQLQAQLAEKVAAKQQMQARLAIVNEAIGQAEQGLQTAESDLEKANQLVAERKEAMQNSVQAFDQVQAELTATQSRVSQARADKAAIMERETQLRLAAKQALDQSAAVKQQLQTLETDKQTQSVLADNLAEQLADLKKQLAQLTSQVTETEQRKLQTANTLESQEAQITELQKQLEAASQAALELEEQLQLFRAAYQSPQ